VFLLLAHELLVGPLDFPQRLAVHLMDQAVSYVAPTVIGQSTGNHWEMVAKREWQDESGDVRGRMSR
jgi:hypothetical protein